jgi:Carboxypeptidase regulatory-like domain
LVWVTAALLLGGLSASAQSVSDQPSQPGSLSGRIVDQSGAPIVGAQVRLTADTQSPAPDLPAQNSLTAGPVAVTDDEGRFAFSNVSPGPFRLEINFDGFSPQTFSGSLGPGQVSVIPQVALNIATTTTELLVTPSRQEIAEDQIKEEEKQRVLGVFPNFYVTYVRDAAPLTPRQKFDLAWKSTVDPVNFAVTGVIAGVQQAQNDFNGYGQGVQGYAKRYGASFGDSVAGTFIGGAILPSLLKQDPRYFYNGTGSVRSRVLYALANAVICKGDNGSWQPNYSSILGDLAAGGISNLYYPAKDRNGLRLTAETALIGIGATAATNLLQEFVIRKFTPASSNHQAGKTQHFIAKVSSKLIREGD